MTVLVVCLLVVLYFIPTVVGIRTSNAPMIFLVNLLFGWTIVGWIASLSIALWREEKNPVYVGGSPLPEQQPKLTVRVIEKPSILKY